MRRFIARALGSLALGALLAVGVGSVAAAADTGPASSTTVSSSSHARPNDWWA